MGIFPTSSHKIDKIDERMTLNGKNKDAGVVIRGAVTLIMVTTVLLMTGLQRVPSHILLLGLSICVKILLGLLTFPTRNLPCRRTLFTFEFARYHISSECLQLENGSFLTDVDGFFHALILASYLFTDVL